MNFLSFTQWSVTYKVNNYCPPQGGDYVGGVGAYMPPPPELIIFGFVNKIRWNLTKIGVIHGCTDLSVCSEYCMILPYQKRSLFRIIDST